MTRFDFVRLATLAEELEEYSYQALRYHAEETELLPVKRSHKGAVLVPRDFAVRVVKEAPNFNSLSQLLSAISYSYSRA